MSILTLVMFMGLASAALVLTGQPPSSILLTLSDNATTFTISNTTIANINITSTSFPTVISDLDGNSVTLAISIVGNSLNVPNVDFSVAITDIDDGFNLGRYQSATPISITAISATNSADNQTITIPLYFEEVYCKYGEIGSEIEVISVEDRSEGEPWEWEPLKNIKIITEVENSGTETKRVTVKMGVYDVSKDRFISLNDGEDKELYDSVRISEDDSEKLTFEFKLPADISDSKDYRFYVKVYEKGDENVQCISKIDFDDGDSGYNQEINVILEDEIGIDELTYDEVIFCGTTNTLEFKLYNFDLGNDEEMRVNIFNSAFGIDSYSEKFELDNGDSQDLLFEFSVPQDAEEKLHRIAMTVEYNYRESTDTYRESNSENSFYVRVEGGCTVEPENTATVTASLESEAKAGEELVVKVSVTNTADSSVTYTLNAAGFTSWASSADLNPLTLSLAAGASGDVLITFEVDEDVEEGEYTFDVEVISGNEMVLKQPVSVTIEKSSRFGITGASIRDNPYIWAIGLINLVLVLVIIIVAIKLARK